MEKLKFKSAGQFLVALESGPLYAENGIKYVLNADSVCNILEVEIYDVYSECVLSVQGIARDNVFTRQPSPKDR